MRLVHPGEQRPGVAVDTTPPDVIKGFLEDGFTPRVYNPLQDPAATERLDTQRKAWADLPHTTTTFTSGVFDVFHGNHRGYLIATKLAAAPHHYARFDETSGKPWEALSPDEQKVYLDYVIGDNVIKQVVSIDGDLAVSERKGHNPAKGKMERPIYGWDSRARDVLSASITVGNVTHTLVDAVTIHDRVEPGLAGTPHAGILEIGRFVRPDVWGIYYESTDILDGLAQTTPPEELAAMHPTLLYTSEGLYHDTLLDGPFSTTALARRIGGAIAPAC
jgi:hypothetical protein